MLAVKYKHFSGGTAIDFGYFLHNSERVTDGNDWRGVVIDLSKEFVEKGEKLPKNLETNIQLRSFSWEDLLQYFYIEIAVQGRETFLKQLNKKPNAA